MMGLCYDSTREASNLVAFKRDEVIENEISAYLSLYNVEWMREMRVILEAEKESTICKLEWESWEDARLLSFVW